MSTPISPTLSSEAISEVKPLPLPTELWLNIFPFLTSSDLQSISLTCPSFRVLAQPLLFSVLDISPFLLAYNTGTDVLRPRRYLTRTLARISCYQLPHLAPAVRHCWISPYPRTGFPPRDHRDDLDPHLVIDAVVSVLPSFPNLTMLSWHCSAFTPQWWEVVRSLPLTRLWLNSCSVLYDPLKFQPLPLLNITHLDLDQWAWEGKITDHPSIHEDRHSGVHIDIFPLVINPGSIQSISCPREDTAIRLLSTLADFASPTGLRILRIPYAAMSAVTFIPAILQCNSLEELRIFPPVDNDAYIPTSLPPSLMPSLPPSALPNLTIYSGPYCQLPAFAHNRYIKRLSLWGTDNHSSQCEPTRICVALERLASMRTSSSLTALQLSVTRITRELMNSISMLNNLRELVVLSQDGLSRGHEEVFMPASGPEPALEILPTSPITILYLVMRTVDLPPNLSYLRLSTCLNSGNLDTETQEAEAERFLEDLAARHRNLRVVEVAYGVYWTGVYRIRWERAKEHRNVDSEMAVDSEGHRELGSDGESDTSPLRQTHEPLGKLTLTENRRTVLLQERTMTMADDLERAQWRYWYLAVWTRVRELMDKVLGSS